MLNGVLCRNGFHRANGIYEPADSDHARVLAEALGHSRSHASFVLRDNLVGHFSGSRRPVSWEAGSTNRGAGFFAAAARFNPRSAPCYCCSRNASAFKSSNPATIVDSFALRRLDPLLVNNKFLDLRRDQK